MDQKLHARKKMKGAYYTNMTNVVGSLVPPCLRQKQMSTQYNKQPWGENRQTWAIKQYQQRSVPRLSLRFGSLKPKSRICDDN